MTKMKLTPTGAKLTPTGAKLRPRRVYFDIKKKTPYIIKNGKRVFIRLKKDGGGNTTIDHRTIKDKRQIVKVIVNTTKPHEVKSKPRRKRRIILAKKEEQTTKAGNERTIYVPHYMPFPGHSQQPITVNVREGGKDKEKSVIPTPANVNKPEGISTETQTEGRPEGISTETQTEGRPEGISTETQTEGIPEGISTETQTEIEEKIKDEGSKSVNPNKYNIRTTKNIEGLKEIATMKSIPFNDFDDIDILRSKIIDYYNIVLNTKTYKIPGPQKIKLEIEDYQDDMKRLEKERLKEEQDRQLFGMGKSSGLRGVGFPSGAKGLTTKEINKLMKDEGYDVVKAIPSDCIPELVNDVNKKTEKFGFIINNETHTQPGEHWRACFIDIPEGNVCWFDSLCGEPTRKEMKGIKVLIDKIKPEYYLKFKINRIKLQGDTTNCGWFCCKFIDDMMSGKKFKEATGWDVINGERGVENYKEKHGCMPERWGCI